MSKDRFAEDFSGIKITKKPKKKAIHTEPVTALFRSLSLTVWRATRHAQTRRFKAAGIDSIVGDFDAAITDAVEGYLSGKYGRARGQRVFEGAIQSAWLPAAEAGFREGGGDPEDFTDDELAEIRDAEAEQLGYARDWWVELGALRDVEDYDPGTRLGLYVSSLRSWYEAFRLYGDKNKMLQWVLGDTEEHCEDEGDTYGCANLAGTWHRWKWYEERGLKPRMPGSATTCGGYNCKCRLVDREGKEYFVDE